VKVLCGDIGGTNTRLAIFDVGRGVPEILEEKFFRSRDYSSLEDIVKQFLTSKTFSLECACLGIAGPVRNGRCETTNLPWVVEIAHFAESMNMRNVYLINDLQANSYGILMLDEDDFLILNKGNGDRKANAAVISAGTGLGEAGLYWDGQQYHPFASEGGHCNFGPGDELQTALLNFLLKKYGHASWERVLSGPGFLNIYEFLCGYRSVSPSEKLWNRMKNEDPAAVVTQAGLSGDCLICAEALEIFTYLYGAEAGDLALKVMATSGVFIGGGIAPKIIEKLKAPHFMKGFLNKGRMLKVMRDIPVKVILNDQTALLGTAQYAKLMMKY
jgi:glucokinase